MVDSGVEGDVIRDLSVAWRVMAIAIASLSVSLFLKNKERPEVDLVTLALHEAIIIFFLKPLFPDAILH